MPQPKLTASQVGIEKAKTALIDKGWSRQDLANYVVVEGKSRKVLIFKLFINFST